MIVQGDVTHSDNHLERNKGKYPEEVRADEILTKKETRGTPKKHAGNPKILRSSGNINNRRGT